MGTSIPIHIYLSIHPSAYPSVYISVYPSPYICIHLTIQAKTNLSIHLSGYTSIRPSVCPHIDLSFSPPSPYTSIRLLIYHHTHLLFLHRSIPPSPYTAIYLSVLVEDQFAFGKCQHLFSSIHTNGPVLLFVSFSRISAESGPLF